MCYTFSARRLFLSIPRRAEDRVMDIIALGGINLDILGQSDGDFVLGDSNPGRVLFRAGGVCRNIAAEIARQGHRVSLLSCLGSGRVSRLLRDMCASDGLDTSLCVESAADAGVYLALHGGDGEMLAALNDMRCMDGMTPEAVLPRLEGRKADLMILDCNLPGETISAVARKYGRGTPLFLDPVSVFKAERCLGALPFLSAVKPNLIEARRLTGRRDAADCAAALLDMGVKAAYVSMGAQGVYYACGDERGVCPAPPLPEGTPLTGAGDALCAGLIRGMLMNKTAAECASLGVTAAADRLTRRS